MAKEKNSEVIAKGVLPGVGFWWADWNIRRRHVVPADLPFSQLKCKEGWNSLTDTQRHFVHHFARASWSGSRICTHQLSKESPDIMEILLLLFSSTDIEDLKRRSIGAGVTQKEWEYFLGYVTCFLSNLGNYLAFGDLKIVPGIPEQKLSAVVKVCPLQGQRKQRLESLWEKTRSSMYSLSPGERNLGFPPDGCSAYYSEDITSREVELVSEWMKQANIEPWNTRIWRRPSSGNYASLPEYDLRIASALEVPIETHVFESKCVINVIRGDFKEDLGEVVRHLKDALPYADNDTQREMIKFFVLYLETGSVDFHKRSQEIWLDQKDIFIQFNLGFIETYRDPGGSRAEFEGFVATINRAATKQFATLIDRADLLLSVLPWPKEYEADEFLCPAFECIEILSYANGTVPAGISLPNYEGVRETHGSKNFCLANVVEGHDSIMKVLTNTLHCATPVNPETIETPNSLLLPGKSPCDSRQHFWVKRIQKFAREAKETRFLYNWLSMNCSVMDLGNFLRRAQEGTTIFLMGRKTLLEHRKSDFISVLRVMHPFTDEAVTTFYGPGDSWNSIFGRISSAFEECRAECVGLYLSALPQAIEVFGHVGEHAEDIMYVNWLMMARAGLLALEYFSVETGVWRQAHMQARFGIFRALLNASEEDAKGSAAQEVEQNLKFLDILPLGNDEIILHLNRDKIRTVGLPVIRELLVKLQVYKSTADVEKGSELFTELTTVPKEMLKYRKSMLINKRPRPLFVQINTKLLEVDGLSRVEMEEFEPTAEGFIQSYVAHFKD